MNSQVQKVWSIPNVVVVTTQAIGTLSKRKTQVHGNFGLLPTIYYINKELPMVYVLQNLK